MSRRRVAPSPKLLRLAARQNRANRANTIGVDSSQALSGKITASAELSSPLKGESVSRHCRSLLE